MASSSASLLEQCSQLDSEIKDRQQQFGVDLYDLFEDQEYGGDAKKNAPPIRGYHLQQLKEHWVLVNDEILKYHRNMPENNKRRRRLRVGSINSTMSDQWVLQRKQKFGVDCFDIVLDVLGTSNGNLLTKKEKQVHSIINKAVKDVLELERRKETLVNEFEDTTPCQKYPFCDSILDLLCVGAG